MVAKQCIGLKKFLFQRADKKTENASTKIAVELIIVMLKLLEGSRSAYFKKLHNCIKFLVSCKSYVHSRELGRKFHPNHGIKKARHLFSISDFAFLYLEMNIHLSAISIGFTLIFVVGALNVHFNADKPKKSIFIQKQTFSFCNSWHSESVVKIFLW